MPCDCDFTWNLGNCSNVTFNANCQNPMAGNYTYSWDIFCDNNPELTVVVGAPNNAFSYGFDCGAGTYTVCLKVTDPAGNICTTTHTVVVPNTCCGSASGSMICHPTDPYKYNFTINVTPDISVSNCNYVLTSAYPLSNLVYLGNTITGCIAVTDPVPTALNFTLQSIVSAMSPACRQLLPKQYGCQRFAAKKSVWTIRMSAMAWTNIMCRFMPANGRR
ncbi:MAG: PKD domain-containing protein [Lewinellaceae bacterium]|nr:PKD domain-containing protein [Lewinellaceae bacterium]